MLRVPLISALPTPPTLRTPLTSRSLRTHDTPDTEPGWALDCVARLGRAWLARLMSTRVSNPFSYTVSKLNIYISYANGMWVVLRVSSTVWARLSPGVARQSYCYGYCFGSCCCCCSCCWWWWCLMWRTATLSLVTHSQAEQLQWRCAFNFERGQTGNSKGSMQTVSLLNSWQLILNLLWLFSC